MNASEILELKQKLDRGLYINNLREMIGQCMKLARTVNEPLAFYVLACIFDDIIRNWEERPLSTAEVREMEEKICSELESVLTSVSAGHQSQQTWDDLNTLVRAFLR